mmetsp:Transcript_35387/g.117266  ORF Transcript_35387/g.117266 Transcript_35387/m.117266 type:complete len:237 (-) Transcript_35387:636-1346(-)
MICGAESPRAPEAALAASAASARAIASRSSARSSSISLCCGGGGCIRPVPRSATGSHGVRPSARIEEGGRLAESGETGGKPDARERSSSSSSRPKTICCSTSSTLKTPPLACQSSWMMRRTSTCAPHRKANRIDCSVRIEALPAEPAPSRGKASSSIIASRYSRPIPSAGNLRCIAPRRYPRAWRRFLTVSYTTDGTPTEVMYMIDSRGSSIGLEERSCAGGTSSCLRSRLTYRRM